MRIISHLLIFCIFCSYLLSQVFSEYSYPGANQTAMAVTINANTSNENGLFQNPASIAGFKDNIIIAGQADVFNQSYLPYQYVGLIYNFPIVNRIGISFQSLSTKNGQVELSSE